MLYVVVCTVDMRFLLHCLNWRKIFVTVEASPLVFVESSCKRERAGKSTPLYRERPLIIGRKTGPDS